MHVRYVTCSHYYGDDCGDIDVPSMQDYNGHTNMLKDHERHLDEYREMLRAHDKSIKGVSDTAKKNCDDILNHAGRIESVEDQVKKMPQVLREALLKMLDESVKLQLDTFGKQLATLKDERDAVSKQTAELYKLRSDLTCGIEAMKKQCEETEKSLIDLQQQRNEMKIEVAKLQSQGQEARKLIESIRQEFSNGMQKIKDLYQLLKDEFAKQTNELKLSIPVPKKFAKFLFVQHK